MRQRGRIAARTRAMKTAWKGSRATARAAAGHAEALGVLGHVHVGREDGDERRDQPPARRRAARSGAMSAAPPAISADAAGVHELAVRPGGSRGMIAHVPAGRDEVQGAGQHEERADERADGAHRPHSRGRCATASA